MNVCHTVGPVRGGEVGRNPTSQTPVSNRADSFPEPIHVISLGAGVQSSTMALMAACGKITPMPVAGIFADTGDEPDAVMQWLAKLEALLPFPVHKVSAGHLSKDFLHALTSPTSRCGQPPFFVRNPDNDGNAAADSGGMLWRKCTKDYKLNPIRRAVRKLCEEHDAKKCVQWIGISLDEAHRMKDSEVKYITNRYPLIELRLTRGDCVHWLKKHLYPEPPKSACVFCPYTSDSRWSRMKQEDGEAWKRAIAFDRSLRINRVNKVAAGIKGELFVHRSMQPLEDVHFESDSKDFQMDLFGNECEGMCGV